MNKYKSDRLIVKNIEGVPIVGKLDNYNNEETSYSLLNFSFKKYGNIIDISTVIIDMGIAYQIIYLTDDECNIQKAIKELNGHKINGKIILIGRVLQKGMVIFLNSNM